MSSIARTPSDAIPADARALIEALNREIGNAHTLEERIAIIARHATGRVTFSTSLGLEDQAVLHAIAVSQTGIDVFTLDTGRHFPETLDTVADSEFRYRVKIRLVAPEAADVEQLVARDGINGFRNSIEARKACCNARKVLPLKRALAGADIWITGLRRDQSGVRVAIPFAEWEANFSLVKVNPLADWPLDQLEAYIATNDIPVNALHARGFPSIGCQPCTRAIRPGEDIRAGRWWWESPETKECGLHRPDRVEVSQD